MKSSARSKQHYLPPLCLVTSSLSWLFCLVSSSLPFSARLLVARSISPYFLIAVFISWEVSFTLLRACTIRPAITSSYLSFSSNSLKMSCSCWSSCRSSSSIPGPPSSLMLVPPPLAPLVQSISMKSAPLRFLPLLLPSASPLIASPFLFFLPPVW